MNKRLKTIIALTLIMGLAVGCSKGTNSNTAPAEKSTVSSTVDKNMNSSVKVTDTSVVIGDTTYLYGKDNSKMMDSKMIPDTDIYYGVSKDSKSIDGNLYGTVHMTYAEYYQNEITKKTDLLSDGMYDGISSATSASGSHSKDYPSILAYTPGEEKDGEVIKPFTIDGIETVDIAINPDIYVQGLILNKTTNGESQLGKTVSKIVLNESMNKPLFNNNVKTLLADGSYSKGEMITLGESPVDTSSIKVSPEVLYDSRYGDYELTLRFEGFDTEEGSQFNYSNYLMNLYSATIMDSNGNIAGAKHYEDIWDEQSRKYWISIALTNGEYDAHGYKFENTRFQDFFQDRTLKPGKYSVVVKSRGFQDLSTDFEVGISLKDGEEISIEDSKWNYADSTSISIDTSKLPKDFKVEDVVLSTKYSKKNLEKDVDFTYDSSSKILSIKDTDLTGPHNYTLKLLCDGYEPAITSFNLTASLEETQISMENGALKIMDNADVSLNDYTKNIFKLMISSSEGEKEQYWQGWGTTIVNEDGTINSEAAKRDGSSIFKSGETYTIKVTAHGYKSFTFEYTAK